MTFLEKVKRTSGAEQQLSLTVARGDALPKHPRVFGVTKLSSQILLSHRSSLHCVCTS